MSFKQELIKLREEYIKTEKYLDVMIESAEKKDYETVLKESRKFQIKANSIIKKIGEIPRRHGIIEQDRRVDLPVAIGEKRIEVITKGDAIKIILPELLPHKPMYDVVNKEMRYDYDISSWKIAYIKAFEKAFSNKPIKPYDEKVMISFIHHGSTNGADPDNYDTKGIIDVIALFFLKDDCKGRVCYFINGVEDTNEYTEVIIKPFRQ